MTAQDLGAMRVGLVLSGGGAKGAYQIGCWKRLRASGLDRFEAVSGSSVGAINAVFVATGRLERAEEAWRRLRGRDVIGLRLRSVLRLPAWLVAALGSEFSPFKLTRLSDRVSDARTWWAHPAACAAAAMGIWLVRGLLPPGWGLLAAAIPLGLGSLALAHRYTRPIFLRPVFTDNAPLARTLARVVSDADVQALREAGRPVYGVLSQYCPGVPGTHRWSGWAPSYERLDHATDAAALCRMLVQGTALPGFLEGGELQGRAALDGAWTDNIPAAPLLFGGHALDLVIVIYLKRVVRHTPRPNSLGGVVGLLVRDAVRASRQQTGLLEWAAARWQAFCASRRDAPGGTAPVPSMPDPSSMPFGRMPRILEVHPSRRIGNFFTGTLWFSRAKSAKLIALGERDMDEALERLFDQRPAPSGLPVLSDAYTPR